MLFRNKTELFHTANTASAW